MTKLTGPQYERLTNALVQAFSPPELDKMVRFRLDEHLESITPGGDFENTVYYLIGWADRKGRLEDLLNSAIQYNPDNRRLSESVATVLGEIRDPGRPPVAVPPPPTPNAKPTAVPNLNHEEASADQPIYVERPADRDILGYLRQSDGVTVTVKGHRQVGKTLLLARMHKWAEETGRASCVLSLRDIDKAILEGRNTTALFQEIAGVVARKLRPEVDPLAGWAPMSPGANFSQFIERELLRPLGRPVLLLFDDVDQLFPYETCRTDLFTTLRSWCDKRTTDFKRQTWGRLSMVVCHATDPALWIKNLSQSPFNVDVAYRVVLDDFATPDPNNRDCTEVVELSRRCRVFLTPEELDLLTACVGGHPFLLKLGLWTLLSKQWTVSDLTRAAISEDGPFISHLRELRERVRGVRSVKGAFRAILGGQTVADYALFDKLWAAGLVRGEARGEVKFRYKLYEDYFKKHRL
jgi:hypothetical protein